MKTQISLKLVSSILLAVLILLSFTGLTRLNASGGNFPAGCAAPYGIPTQCSGAGEYEPDFNCINGRFIDPNLVCCPNKCTGDPSPTQLPEDLTRFDFFGTTIGLNLASPNAIPVLVNIGISTILGLLSFYALFRGVYVAAFVRTSTTDPARITAVNLELRNLLIGFILAWGAIFIVQLVANVIGLGSLQDLEVSGTEGAYLITIT